MRADFLVPLPIGETAQIDGWTLRFADANHCPGAAQAVFVQSEQAAAEEGRASRPRKYVHCGDMRACDAMQTDDALQSCRGCDAVFLDTTYAAPKHTFPPQSEAIEYCARIVQEAFAKPPDERPLVLVSAYTIGKERILLEIAKRCNVQIGVDRRRHATLRRIDLPEDELAHFVAEEWGRRDGGDEDNNNNNSNNSNNNNNNNNNNDDDEKEGEKSLATTMRTATGDAPVRIVPMDALGETFPYFQPNWDNCDLAARATGAQGVLGIVPSGWMLGKKGKSPYSQVSKGNHTIHLVPYSEHSSFTELREYVKFLRPVEVRPTVFADEGDRRRIVARFRDLVDTTSAKQFFLQGMAKQAVTEPQMTNDVVNIDDLDDDDDADAGADEMEEEEEQQEGRQDSPATMDMASHHPAAETSLRQERPDVACPVCQRMISPNAINAHVASCLNRHGQGDAASSPPAAKKRGRSQQVPPKPAAPKPAAPKPAAPKPAAPKPISPKPAVAAEVDAPPLVIAASSPSSPPTKRAKQATLATFFGASAPSKSAPNVEAPSKAHSDNVKKVSSTPPAQQTQQVDVVHSPTIARAASSIGATAQDADDEDEEVREGHLQLSAEVFEPGKHAPSPIHVPPTARSLPYLHLSRAYRLISAERGRLKTVNMLTNTFHAVIELTPQDVLCAVQLTMNDVDGAVASMDDGGGDEQQTKLQVGGGAVSAAIIDATGASQAQLRKLYREHGDIGDVVYALRTRQTTLGRPKPLTVRGVADAFRELASYSGQGSALKKRGVLLRMLRASRQDECRFLARTAIRHLRIGATATLVLTSLGRAACYASKRASARDTNESENGDEDISISVPEEELSSWSEALLDAYHIYPNLAEIVPALLEGGKEAVQALAVVHPGTPMQPMLAKVARSVDEVMNKLATPEGAGGFVAQFKYDGMRCQLHILCDGTVKLFSRNCENFSQMWPELVSLASSWRDGDDDDDDGLPRMTDAVLDCEIVAVDAIGEQRRLLPFQNLSTRSRGSSAAATNAAAAATATTTTSQAGGSVRVLLVLFDVLSVNGESLVATPLETRMRRLTHMFAPRVQPGVLELASQQTFAPSDAEELSAYLQLSISQSCEGLMAKSLASLYEPSKRSDSWMKLKRDMIDGLADTFDVVPIGAWYGNGRKAGWFSPWLVALYDRELGQWQCLCRVLSGFSDSFYKAKTQEYTERGLLDRPPSYVDSGERCSVYFTPFEVWEIRGQELSISPVHRAGAHLSPTGSGFSLRFPRFVRIRDDKTIEQATESSDVVDMFERQVNRGGGGGAQ